MVGLNFDFLAYNLTGFFGYLVYNAAMFWSSFVKRQYKELHGADSTEPVQLNDVIFTVCGGGGGGGGGGGSGERACYCVWEREREREGGL